MQRRTFLRSTLAATAALAVPRQTLRAAPFSPLLPYRQPDVLAVTGDGREVTLGASALAELKGRLRGNLLLAGEPGYDDARRILNPSFDRHPALVVQPTGAADIATAVDFARDNAGLLLAVKCGGHSASGQSTCDRGMQIDLSLFRDVRVDPYARRAWVTGGSLLGQLDHESMAHGLVTPMGTVSHTGVGGLVTGGGFGRLARRFGLSIDNLEALQVVTADGRLLNASADENPDLFWGVRGGGGNFGVVTSFEFRLHPMGRTVLGGDIVFPIARARDALTLYGEYLEQAPDGVQVDLYMAQPPGDADGVIGFGVCYSGPPGDADRVLAPIRKLGGHIADEVKPVDYVALQRSGDVDDPRAMGTYLKSGFIGGLSPALVAAIVDGFQGDPRRSTVVFFQQSGGAIGRVPAQATAFAQRDARGNMLGAVNWRNGDDPTPHIEWMRRYWPALDRHTQGFYVNDTEVDATTAQIRDNYRANHDRLVAVKNRYDPKNLFRLNANVKPTV